MGNGFGSQRGTSTVNFGSAAASIATGGWIGNGQVNAIVPSPLANGVYPINMTIVGSDGSVQTTNTVSFGVQAPVGSGPQINQIIPSNGPIGSYVTILGSGFGMQKGAVRFTNGLNIASVVNDPACNNSWTPNAIVVKVPPEYDGNGSPDLSKILHQITVTPAGSTATSAPQPFLVDDTALRPGVCSISPNNGPVGTAVTVTGEGFGDRSSGTRNNLEF